MESAQRAAETKERVLPYPFWVGLTTHSAPDVRSQLLQTARAACTAVVQAAPSAKLTVRLSSPPAPNMLGLLRTSCRTLPATLFILNNNQHFSLQQARNTGRVLITQLGCAVIARLALVNTLEGKGWLVDAGLLQDVQNALPGLRRLDLVGVSLPSHASAYADTSLDGLATVRVRMTTDHPPGGMAALLAALGVRSDGSVVRLIMDRDDKDGEADGMLDLQVEAVLGRMLQDNQLHALRRLSLPNTTLHPAAAAVVHGLIHNAPALEHLQLEKVALWPEEHAHKCVPWRILDLTRLDVSSCRGLPLGSSPEQPPLIVRVRFRLGCYGLVDNAEAGATHLTSTTAGHRHVRLECSHDTVVSNTSHIGPLLRVLTLTRFGLSNLILDGIDTADGIKDLDDLSTSGLTLTLDRVRPLDLDLLAAGLLELPHATKLEVRAVVSEPDSTAAQLWAGVGVDLLALLPPHITDVRLSCSPDLKQVAEMCVLVSRVPHRQMCPLRLCVPDVPAWFVEAAELLRTAGIEKAGIVGVL